MEEYAWNRNGRHDPFLPLVADWRHGVSKWQFRIISRYEISPEEKGSILVREISSEWVAISEKLVNQFLMDGKFTKIQDSSRTADAKTEPESTPKQD